MKERIIIHTIQLEWPLQRTVFQLKLPANARRITKVFSGFIGVPEDPETPLIDPGVNGLFLYHNPTFLAGELGLSVAGAANHFYRDYIPATDTNAFFLDYEDVNLADWGSPGINHSYFPGPMFRVAKPFSVDIPVTNPLVEGWFQDALYESGELAVLYSIRVYLWVELDDQVLTDRYNAVKLSVAASRKAGETNVEVNSLVVASVENKQIE